MLEKIFNTILFFIMVTSIVLFMDILVEDLNVSYNSYDKTDNFYSFSRYYTKDFEQAEYGTNCGPTMFCDVISYYEEKNNEEYISKVDGRITQTTYDTICEYLNYAEKDGTYVKDLKKGLESYFNGKNGMPKCKVEAMTLGRWEKVKRHINDEQILLLVEDEHVYMVGGYLEIEEGKYLDVFTTWLETPFAYIPYTQETMLYKVTIK